MPNRTARRRFRRPQPPRTGDPGPPRDACDDGGAGDGCERSGNGDAARHSGCDGWQRRSKGRAARERADLGAPTYRRRPQQTRRLFECRRQTPRRRALRGARRAPRSRRWPALATRRARRVFRSRERRVTLASESREQRRRNEKREEHQRRTPAAGGEHRGADGECCNCAACRQRADAPRDCGGGE